MPTQARPLELRSMLNRWDQANRSARKRILHEFVEKNHARTASELEFEFSNGASLFLTRLCAHLKTSVPGKGSVGITLQAISIFISAASGNQFLNEFIDVGGLEVVVNVLKNERAMEALQLLSATAACGSKYKNMILARDLEAVPVICNFVAKSENSTVQELSRILLVNLGHENHDAELLQQNLIQLLRSPKAQVQRTASQIMRQLLAPFGVEGTSPIDPLPSLVDSIAALFASLQPHIIYESLELAMCAVMHPKTRHTIVTKIAELLRPEPYHIFPPGVWEEGFSIQTVEKHQSKIPSTLIQQLAAVRLLVAYFKSKDEDKVAIREEVVNMLIDANIVPNLLVACANTDCPESKKNALEGLKLLLKCSTAADGKLLSLIGVNSHALAHDDPIRFAEEMGYEYLNSLLRQTGNFRLQFFRIGDCQILPEAPEDEITTSIVDSTFSKVQEVAKPTLREAFQAEK